jgi:hypothetical protein
MAKTWRRAIQKYGSFGAISFEKAFKVRVSSIFASTSINGRNNDLFLVCTSIIFGQNFRVFGLFAEIVKSR